MTGPIPMRAVGPYRRTARLTGKQLGSLSKVPAKIRQLANDEIIRKFYGYEAKLNAVKASPMLRELEAVVQSRHVQLCRLILLLKAPLPMPDLSGSKVDGGLRSAQFMGIVAEILENSGGSLSQFKESAERAIEAVESFDLEHLEILVALEQSRNSSAFVKVSERALRSDFFTPSIAFFAGFA